MKRSFREAVLFSLIGGALFWLPDIAIHLTTHFFKNLPSLHIVLIGIFCTLIPIIGIIRLRKAYKGNRPLSIPVFSLFGIWFLASPAMTVNAYLISDAFSWNKEAFLDTMFPPFAFAMSFYDGSTVALVIVTIYFLILAVMSIVRLRRAKSR